MKKYDMLTVCLKLSRKAIREKLLRTCYSIAIIAGRNCFIWKMGNTKAASAVATKQFIRPDQRLKFKVTLTLMETLSPEWRISGQDHNIWSKMPLGEWHLQQLSFPSVLIQSTLEEGQLEFWCRFHCLDSHKTLTCTGQRGADRQGEAIEWEQCNAACPERGNTIPHCSSSLLPPLDTRLYLTILSKIFPNYRHFLALSSEVSRFST